MTLRANALLACCSLAVVLTMPVPLVAQDTLSAIDGNSLPAARELYASAEYQNALAMLERLLASSPPTPERQSIELYRILCLTAIGSSRDVDSAIDSMIARDPLYRPDLEDLPPRLRGAFSEARRRLLPGAIQQNYVSAKAAFDRKDFKAATEGFMLVLIALSDPDIAAAAEQPPLADLRVLATGFNDLAVRALAPPPPPPAAPAPAIPTAVAEPPAPVEPRIRTADEANVEEPVVLRQDVPPFPGNVLTARRVLLDVVIDETGAVESATLVETTDPVYNRVLLAAAKNWAYRPARVDGAPVKFRKRIQINLTPGR